MFRQVFGLSGYLKNVHVMILTICVITVKTEASIVWKDYILEFSENLRI